MTPLAALPRWLRAHPLAADALLAAAALAAILISSVYPDRGANAPPPADLGPAEVVLATAACAVLVLRRRVPWAVLAATMTLTIAHVIASAGDPRSPIALSVVVSLYTVAARTDRHTTWRIALLTIGVLTFAMMLFGDRPWYADENLGVFAWTGMAAGVGDAVRSRRAVVDAIRERAERAERTREEEARRRVAEERVRIARELHDVVAHHIALVNVQAGVASHVMESRPDQAREALAHVRDAGRTALEELRTTVGLLRQSGDPHAPTEPAPGLAMLTELVEGFVRAGTPVSVEVASELGPRRTAVTTRVERAAEVIGGLPAAVDLAAYRVLQEALTNVRKHAGAGAHAVVSLSREADELDIAVRDDGPGAAGTAPDEGRDDARRDGGGKDGAEGDADGERVGGLGLVGMRERAAALGGRCTAGERTDGRTGFEVRVRLPLRVAADAGTGGGPVAGGAGTARPPREREANGTRVSGCLRRAPGEAIKEQG
ncbi:sensor histidine kinase [Streptomyces sp. NPDC004134]|uniref:sensor histidine kinase n=1 Tax=Streptomyces sp. NPDC004134 TaxID=3364691 RepID=UPI0036A08F9E